MAEDGSLSAGCIPTCSLLLCERAFILVCFQPLDDKQGSSDCTFERLRPRSRLNTTATPPLTPCDLGKFFFFPNVYAELFFPQKPACLCAFMRPFSHEFEEPFLLVLYFLGGSLLIDELTSSHTVDST